MFLKGSVYSTLEIKVVSFMTVQIYEDKLDVNFKMYEGYIVLKYFQDYRAIFEKHCIIGNVRCPGK